MYAYQIWKYPYDGSAIRPKDKPFLWFEDTGAQTIIGTMAEIIDKLGMLSDNTQVTKVVIERVTK